jgi:thiamine biosynthesis lipoprotein
LWDFRAPEPAVPPAAEIDRRARLVGYRRVELDEAAGTVRLPEPGMMIGLGGIAKGYALAEAAEVLRGRGLEDFLLVSGGQVYAAGRRSGVGEDRPWRVGVRDPRGGPEDFFALLELADASASTSGDYERYFVADGVRYHHILDPRTGRPARGLRSATVVSADAVLADALSTGIFVMGPEAGLALAARLPGVEAVLVDGDGGVLVTSGLEDRLEVLHPPAK